METQGRHNPLGLGRRTSVEEGGRSQVIVSLERHLGEASRLGEVSPDETIDSVHKG